MSRRNPSGLQLAIPQPNQAIASPSLLFPACLRPGFPGASTLPFPNRVVGQRAWIDACQSY